MHDKDFVVVPFNVTLDDTLCHYLTGHGRMLNGVRVLQHGPFLLPRGKKCGKKTGMFPC